MKIFLFLLFLHPSLSSAAELKVRYLAREFTLFYSNNDIQLKGKDIDLSLKRKSCSEVIFKNFSKELQDQLNQKSLVKNQEMVSYTLKGKDQAVPLETSLGKFLVTLPEEMKRMKVEEMIRCSN